jgi:hypothetical protein
MHVNRLAALPPHSRALGVIDHRCGVCSDARAMKCGLSKAALSQVEFVLTRQQAVAQQPARALETAALVKILLIGDEDIPNEIGMTEEVDILRPDPPMRDVTVLALHRDHHRERIARDLENELSRISGE